MDGVTAIHQRIAEIQARIAEFEPARASVSASSAASGVAFRAALDSVSTAGVRSIGSGASLVNADNVPLELVGYGNGTIPASALSRIDGTSHRIWAPAARSDPTHSPGSMVTEWGR